MGGTTATAQALAGTSAAGGASYAGIISGAADVDVFSFNSGVGPISVTLALAPSYVNNDQRTTTAERTNLDASVTLTNAAGSVLQTWNNNNGLLRGVLAPAFSVATAVSPQVARARAQHNLTTIAHWHASIIP